MTTRPVPSVQIQVGRRIKRIIQPKLRRATIAIHSTRPVVICGSREDLRAGRGIAISGNGSVSWSKRDYCPQLLFAQAADARATVLTITETIL